MESPLKIIEGDLLDVAFRHEGNSTIIHGCNCFHKMAAGLAKQIKEKYPQAYKADLETKYGDRNKLGSYSYATIIEDTNIRVIINAYIQYRYGRDKNYLNLYALKKVLEALNRSNKNTLFIPYRLGCGLAGGDWNKVFSIIKEKLPNSDVKIVRL